MAAAANGWVGWISVGRLAGQDTLRPDTSTQGGVWPERPPVLYWRPAAQADSPSWNRKGYVEAPRVTPMVRLRQSHVCSRCLFAGLL
jgi:hypothetical protein